MGHKLTLKGLFLPLTVILGLIIIYQTMDWQGFLSAGDHGRDLYAFERTLHGELAYRDYWWVYGPLMPFYYALFMKFYGVSILSVLIGQAVLKFAAGLCIFLALSRVASPAAAMLAALWFYVFGQDFFFTYNHIGGILCITGIAAALGAYIKKQRMSFLWAALAISLVLFFIKANFGATAIIITAVSAFMTDRTLKNPSFAASSFYRAAFIYIPALAALGYGFFILGLPSYVIKQCLPYTDASQTYLTSPWSAINSLWTLFITKFFTNGTDFFFAGIVITALIRIAYLAIDRRLKEKADLQLLLMLGMLGTYFIFNFHEYLRSGVWYRSLWSQPLEFMFFFTAIALAIRQNGRLLRFMVWSLIALIGFIGWRAATEQLTKLRISPQYLSSERTKVYVRNDAAWIKTMNDTTDFLSKNLKPNEQFFALPYDPIYYYTTGRKSPTQLLLLCDQQNIPPEQEAAVIQDLEKNKVNWVVISSRMNTQEPGLGTFGKTYGMTIAKYITENFAPVAQFGDWQNEPGWAWNHGTVVLKRK